MNVHYIVAGYLGPRRIEDPRQSKDRFWYLDEHFKSLQRLPHDLARITLVLSTDEASKVCDQELRRYGVPPHVNLVVRPNDIGLSYSAMREAVLDDYEYTIFNEDDYVFTVDHFDRFLVDQMAAAPNVSLLCGCVRTDHGGPHAAISVGIVRTEALLKFGSAAVAAGMPQRLWSAELAKSGHLTDWLHHYASAYWQDGEGVRWFERERANLLGRVTDEDPLRMLRPTFRRAFIMPIQAFERDVRIIYRDQAPRPAPVRERRRRGCLTRSGELTWSPS